MKRTCENCAYFAKNPEFNKYGHCHRYPPSGLENEISIEVFPIVMATDWCGEYKSKEDDFLEQGAKIVKKATKKR